MNNIKTINELKPYVGKLIVCYYYQDYQEEVNNPNFQREYDENKISFQWMFKLTSIKNKNENENIRRITLEGEHLVVLINNQYTDYKTPTPYYLEENGSSNAQSYIRTPTKKEIKMYLNTTRKKRIIKSW